MKNELQELSMYEIEEISGSGFFADIAFALGFAVGAGAKTQKRIESYDNYMLSAMQYGA